jgi:2-polyprenyl-3-methyl-5-hydroxy-6-metoxy-1,4-benzoquinol methylase
MPSTKNSSYAARLMSIQNKSWKNMLSIINPYKWHIRRVMLPPALEIGCGIGRVLKFSPSEIVGVDHNQSAVDICKKNGLTAYNTDNFLKDQQLNEAYNSIIISHVLEHMTYEQAKELLNTYLPALKNNGRVIITCPQEVGYDSDDTHVQFMDFDLLHKLCAECHISVRKSYSFPFPRPIGCIFIYNEFVVIGEKV